MTVTEFTRYDAVGTMFELVDARNAGYMRDDHKILTTCDKNAARVNYGNWNVMKFEPKSKRTLILYVRPADEEV